MSLPRFDPRTQALPLCFLTFLIGAGFIAAHLRWDIAKEVAKNPAGSTGATPTGSPGAAPTPLPPAGTPLTVLPAPKLPTNDEEARNDLLINLRNSFVQLQTLEADLLTPDAAGDMAPAGHVVLTKPTGEDISGLKVHVSYTSTPVTQVLLSDKVVSVYQPTRKFAVTRDAEEAANDWLKDYMELTGNITLTLLDGGDQATRRPALLAVIPRQPKNVRRGLLFVDSVTFLPVRAEFEFPLNKQIVAFDKMKTGHPIDPRAFTVTLPTGMSWSRR